ncbi:hypothetical protein [Sphaerisporangium album]|nr:hypothetical protein [Sphaerisporangium album]
MSHGDVTALVVAGLFTVVCLVLAWLEHRYGPDEPQDDRPRDDRWA